jgi:hypothetical protein
VWVMLAVSCGSGWAVEPMGEGEDTSQNPVLFTENCETQPWLGSIDVGTSCYRAADLPCADRAV